MNGSGIIFLIVLGLLILLLFGILLGIRNQAKSKRLASSIEAEHVFSSSFDQSCIAISFRTKKIIVGGRRSGPRTAAFNQILQVDILKDDEMLTNTKGASIAGRAIVGALIAGPIGALAGAVTAKKRSVQSMRRLALRVVTDSWTEQVLFVDTKGGRKLSEGTRDFLVTQADQFYGFLLSAISSTRTTPAIRESSGA